MLTIRGFEEGDVLVYRLDGENVVGAKCDFEVFHGCLGQWIVVMENDLDFYLLVYGIVCIDQN